MKKLVIVLSIIIVILCVSLVVFTGCLEEITVTFRTEGNDGYTESEYAIIDNELIEVSRHTYFNK